MKDVKNRKVSGNGRTVFAAVLIAALALFILFAVFSPRRAEMSDGTLHFKHLFTKFDVPLADIASVELLEELPPLSKITGIGVYFLSEGKYEVEGYGRCTVSVNQAEPPYIAVTDSAGAGYVFSLNDPEDTRALYEELAQAVD